MNNMLKMHLEDIDYFIGQSINPQNIQTSFSTFILTTPNFHLTLCLTAGSVLVIYLRTPYNQIE